MRTRRLRAKTRRFATPLFIGALPFIVLVLLLLFMLWPTDHAVRLGTFNIENYPKSPRQAEGAFAAVQALDVAALAVQEITDPEDFGREARARLGNHWRFIHSGPAQGKHQRVGVLFDTRRLKLRSTRVLKQTILYPRARPALEARFTRGDDTGEDVLRLIVVHLKAGGSGYPMRKLQIEALRPELRRAASSGDSVVFLGDFNATSEADRRLLTSLADALTMGWVTKSLDCTSYWKRSDGCVSSSLDHAIASIKATSVKARGPCAREGCARRDQCPDFVGEVSDHCPVTFTVRPF